MSNPTNSIFYLRFSVSESAVICLTLLLLMCSSAFAQSPTYQVDHWTTDNGLPQNTVPNIVQTRDGYLWLATFDGLVRFDGARFTVFSKSNTPGITSSRFTLLREDKQGTLWAGTEGDGITAYRDGVFRTYTTADGLLSNRASGTALDQHGNLFQTIDGQFVYWHGNGFVAGEPLYDVQVSRSFWWASGKQWKISLSGITELKDGQEMNYPVLLTRENLADIGALEDRQGHLWIVNPDTGILYYLHDGQMTQFSEKEGVPKGMTLRPACEDQDGGVWFRTDHYWRESEGLVRFKDGRFTFYGHEQGLPLAVYNVVRADREGMIWVGTSKGLYRLKRKFIRTYSTENGLLHNEVYPLLQTQNGDIYIGSSQGLSRFAMGSLRQGFYLKRMFWWKPCGKIGRADYGLAGALEWLFGTGKR